MSRTFALLRSTHLHKLLPALLIVIAGCSLEKKSAVNRGLQNLTAKFNILFNANEILAEKQASYAASYIDDYNEILSVYRDITAQSGELDKDLELVKQKANNIISVKEQSHYIGDAYLLLGKANFLQGNYFDAVEYLNYVTRTFGDNVDLRQEALVWKGRALMYLKKNDEAKLSLDSALQDINPKKKITADIYAAKLQYDINTQNYADGEEMARQAIAHSNNKVQQLRLTFILGQLQELNQKPADAVTSYGRIAKSNAAFDMAFNANLNRIRIEESQNGVKVSRLTRLRSLLRNPNNKDFTDQIYYQIATLQYADNDLDNAIKSYKQSAQASQKNLNQKGLSYLRLADIYFKNKADYTGAKTYYDSTLMSLSPNYPGFMAIQRKADNLQLLADRLQTISREDTLQSLAALDEDKRNKRIDEMVVSNTLQEQAVAVASANAQADPLFNDPSSPQASTPNGGNFYFYNTTALSQGFSNFKRVWGNRKLEDNWRRSNRTASDLTINTLNTAQNVDPDALPDPLQRSTAKVNAGNYRQDIVQNLPLTPALLAQSNLRVYNAYLDIANFYRDVLVDKKEAIAAYELILARFPDNPNKPAIYYNLYRLYSELNAAQSDKFKNLVLSQYPETPFAKTILDPEYSRRLNDEDTEFSSLYNKVYDLYAAKKYPQVITAANSLLGQYPNNRFAAQLLYLRTFAAAHQENLPPFKADLELIAAKYPDDKLITPLVNQHLTYVNTNLAELAARPIVITDGNGNDLEFTLPIADKQQTEYRPPSVGRYEPVADVRAPEKKPELVVAKPVTQPSVQQPATQLTKVKPPALTKDSIAMAPPLAAQPVVPVVTNQPQVTQPIAQPAPVPVKTISKIFTMRDSSRYYFVVNVNSGTINVASSRFGIGQFNRVQYQGKGINHYLKNSGPDNQLIYVGRFNSLESVKDYARAIIPLMPDIMKTPKDKYSFFIITQENLDKLADKKILDSYIDYYQANY
ncbi:tetratricopeptide repeat protein [Mucilaginibacter sp.]|uniref:type IX secretion system periplasmic lipoprotein PorW/SprE n=1 Tax=Mucilaginibacter sp. TaxID=1882438 RepID=UPI0035BC46F2